ncbi:MAG: hypothetical protein BWY46_01362 [Firmicutes bacterium ADurb.Bin300]|nr:MAG: hypothetical protein BWY46_01362 [Firmicutes bacterium ADurb.Bin300]HOD02242.1 NusG domain II-containing protein [Clostridiales bacterium]
MRKSAAVKKNGKHKILFGKSDALILIAAFSVAVFLFFFYNGSSQEPLRAEITVNGELYKSIYLTQAHEETVIIQTDPVVTLKVSQKGISFVNALCPDRTCEKSGVLNKAGSVAVCLPARVIVSVVSDKSSNSGYDAISY